MTSKILPFQIDSKSNEVDNLFFTKKPKLFGLAKSLPAKPAQKRHFLKWRAEHFTVVYSMLTI